MQPVRRRQVASALIICLLAFITGCNSHPALASTMYVAKSSLNTPSSMVENTNLIAIEAENFASQHLDHKRRWLVMSEDTSTHNYPDADLPHYETASGKSYIEILPDTRVNHYETLVRGENFSAQGGNVAVLTYPVYFDKPGKYYVWSRAFSTGSEDNGVHIGLNGHWPETSQRVQFCHGKHKWTWSSAQRTIGNHCGVPNTISVNVPTKGVHTLMISMREDGFELDKLLLTQDVNYQPRGKGIAAKRLAPPPLQEKTELFGIKQYKRIIKPESFKFDKTNNGFEATLALGHKDRGSSSLIVVTLHDTHQNVQPIEFTIRINDKIIGNFKNNSSITLNNEFYFITDKVNLSKGDVIRVTVTNPGDVLSIKKIKSLWQALVISRSQ
ncbi:hypothetical protein Q4575_10530 [Psychrosphaera sp. 1_MG-2023]|uniref:hypothetical protein n=1 Tax=Psychrosphaera sp. 1_MG-2023 TaxID=3062643 RepID=UPI0026E28F72|nr:hypothetical protein [Psychrosphaera sp. 1_MG-2023]MDO6719840.1 hypothetical protein [Psychrosphaera sp. 1_MG-2023]